MPKNKLTKQQQVGIETEREDAQEPRRHRWSLRPRSVEDVVVPQRKRSRPAEPEASARRRLPRNGDRPQRRVSFAVEDTVIDTTNRRKTLPRLNGQSFVADAATAGTRNADAAQAKESEHVSGRLRRSGTLLQQPGRRVSVPLNDEQQKAARVASPMVRVPGRVDPVLLVTVLLLLCIGLVMVYSASSFIAARYYGGASYFFQKQLLGAVLGIAVMLVTMRIDYRVWRRFSLWGMVVAFPLLIIVLLFGTSAYGASRWLAFGSFFSFQPSELIKLVLALYIADWLARKGNQVSSFLYGLTPFVILVGTILGLVLLENDMGTASVIAAFTAAMFFTAGANIFQFLLAMGAGGLIFLTQAFKGYRYVRLIGFLDPFKDVTGSNLQLYQSLLALGSGGWLGVGLGASRQKTGYLPLPYIDSIFAIIGEELGYIGCVIVIALFMILAFRGFRLARRTQDLYGALLATGITTWLIVQALINIGATTATIPYTGVPLPFISFGGTSLVISLAGVGVLLSISRYIQEPGAPALSRKTIEKVTRRKK